MVGNSGACGFHGFAVSVTRLATTTSTPNSGVVESHQPLPRLFQLLHIQRPYSNPSLTAMLSSSVIASA